MTRRIPEIYVPSALGPASLVASIEPAHKCLQLKEFQLLGRPGARSGAGKRFGVRKTCGRRVKARNGRS